MRKIVPETFRLMLDTLRSSLWFVPATMMAASVLLAAAATQIASVRQAGRSLHWISTDGARAILTTIAGSMITVAGVVFSITIVALSVASSQFGPRLLRGFMRDRLNQVVLGTFVSTFLYCLMVLLFVRRQDDGSGVPQLATALAVLLAVLGLAVLVVFIHHVSTSIQASGVIAAVVGELDQQLDRVIDQARGGETRPPAPRLLGQGTPVESTRSDYLLGVDRESLVAWASERDVVVALEARPGDFLVEGDVLLRAHHSGDPSADPPGDLSAEPPADPFDEEALDEAREAFAFGERRTAEGDPLFPIEQLVEIAVRALSTGINDPITAVACVHRLRAALCRLASHGEAPSVHCDEDGRPRLITRELRFADYLASALDPLRVHGARSPIVVEALLELLESLAARVPATEDAGLAEHLAALRAAAESDLAHERDRQRVREQAAKLKRALGGVATGPSVAGGG
ncbi:MAG TPA: DUF2254 domain-containing protein [Thermoanaerobaculia bacterium]|nr:DUF2254 domain-containing protein [Thermoanaerobaculia bacterium]